MTPQDKAGKEAELQETIERCKTVLKDLAKKIADLLMKHIEKLWDDLTCGLAPGKWVYFYKHAKKQRVRKKYKKKIREYAASLIAAAAISRKEEGQ